MTHDLVSISDNPAATREIFLVATGGTVRGNLLDNGPGAPNRTLSVFTTIRAEFPFKTKNGGTLSLQPDGAMSYTPADAFHGIDSFEFCVRDNAGGMAAATAMFRVVPGDAAREGADGYRFVLPGRFEQNAETGVPAVA